MKVTTYRGAITPPKGREKSQLTKTIEAALYRCARSGQPQLLTLDEGEDLRRITYRVRNVAQVNNLSCSISYPPDGDGRSLVIVSVTPKPGYSLPPDEPPEGATPRPRRRH
jgi:hypothetical protein